MGSSGQQRLGSCPGASGLSIPGVVGLPRAGGSRTQALEAGFAVAQVASPAAALLPLLPWQPGEGAGPPREHAGTLVPSLLDGPSRGPRGGRARRRPRSGPAGCVWLWSGLRFLWRKLSAARREAGKCFAFIPAALVSLWESSCALQALPGRLLSTACFFFPVLTLGWRLSGSGVERSQENSRGDLGEGQHCGKWLLAMCSAGFVLTPPRSRGQGRSSPRPSLPAAGLARGVSWPIKQE